jgi:hypothetical protein
MSSGKYIYSGDNMNDIDKMISDAEGYIKSASESSAKAFEKAGMNFNFFGGTMTLSPEMCAQIYRDMIREMLAKQSPIAQKYCLTVVIIPVKDKDGDTALSLQLGLIWPNLTHETF